MNVPHQPIDPDGDPDADLLLHPDPAVAADAAGTEHLLRCWVREASVPQPRGGQPLVVELGGGLRLSAPVRYWSACGWHRFGAAELATADGATRRPADAVTVAALLARTAGAAPQPPGAAGGPGPGGEVAELTGRVADSVRRAARHLAERRARPEPPPGTSAFLDSEQALLLGHPLHPTPKSREGLGEAEAAAYSPELRGSFRPHWFSVDRSVVASDSALPQAADELLAGVYGDRPPEDGRALLPVHPWQAREVLLRPAVRDLLDRGVVRDLGPGGGAPWFPTSSLRTVHRPGDPFMLKLSLGLRITNSRRENLRKELERGVEISRLLDSGLGAEWRASEACAGADFTVVRDPAWLAVDVPGVQGLDVVLRDNAFGPHERAYCLAGLVAETPYWGVDGRPARSRLAALLQGLARRHGRAQRTVAVEWFARYLERLVLPILWLDGYAGIALEAHQQNTLVLLDADGWPAGGRYRDNQGYYYRASRAAELDARLPGIGRRSETFVEDPVVDERFAYYLGANHILGLIGAFGAQRLADEQVLLAVLRQFLSGAAVRSRSGLPQRLLEAPTLRCKANLLTRLRGLDELVGPVETQSVYVTVPNPVAAAGRSPAPGHPANATAGVRR
ncbi:IucA/IucC family protein [Phaeacidiphilus oryzae]|uniref:IucA/IucC family protein n=1 Tax=Phaeacidiphilus oryzae TaxID=348818 RepID=UPI00068BDE3A|nr:IucA/IucC family protein [Phaeacidiphilus oryzae]